MTSDAAQRSRLRSPRAMPELRVACTTPELRAQGSHAEPHVHERELIFAQAEALALLVGDTTRGGVHSHGVSAAGGTASNSKAHA